MSVAAAIRMTSPDEARVIEHASTYAERHGVNCYVISVVGAFPYGEGDADVIRRNLKLIEEHHAVPIMQEGHDVPATLIAVARAFGITTLVLRNGSSRRLGRTVAEQLLCLDPPFDVVVVGSE